MRRKWMRALLCALLLCATRTHASDAPQVPHALEMRGLGIAIALNEDWRTLIAQGRINFLLGYSLQAQGQMMQTVTLDIYFWPEPPPLFTEEMAAERWEDWGAVRLARICGTRKDMTAPEHSVEPQGERIPLPDGGDYAYLLTCYPIPDAQAEGAAAMALLLEQLHSPEAMLRTYAPEPLG